MFSDHRRSEGGEGVEPAGVDKAGGVDVGGGRRPTDRVLEDEPRVGGRRPVGRVSEDEACHTFRLSRDRPFQKIDPVMRFSHILACSLCHYL
jgi:hypothetical protein